MTDDEIIEVASEHMPDFADTSKLVALARALLAAERERCARMVEELEYPGSSLAAAIRKG